MDFDLTCDVVSDIEFKFLTIHSLNAYSHNCQVRTRPARGDSTSRLAAPVQGNRARTKTAHDARRPTRFEPGANPAGPRRGEGCVDLCRSLVWIRGRERGAERGAEPGARSLVLGAGAGIRHKCPHQPRPEPTFRSHYAIRPRRVRY